MAQTSKSRKLDQYIVRFPDGMRDVLKDEAARNNRSMNAEIIERLEASLHPPTQRAMSLLLRLADQLLDTLHVSFDLDKSQLAELDRLATKFGLSKTQIVEKLVENALVEINQNTALGKSIQEATDQFFKERK